MLPQAPRHNQAIEFSGNVWQNTFSGEPFREPGKYIKGCPTETTFRKLKRSFYTKLPGSYAANIIAEVTLNLNLYDCRLYSFVCQCQPQKYTFSRLKVQHADRYDFKTTYGEASNEVVLKLKGIVLGLLPVDAGAARKTSHAVGQATKTAMSIMKQGELNSENIDDSGIDRLEI
ncbi:hypothetical protein V6N11_079919 [Hibiscus sabdariffa]|uniref:DUF7903 domain-containing protein n=1 Tax=Hibiscus sabdariffa TaxID=183260 RepID=A0ABR2RWT4_9ROSI